MATWKLRNFRTSHIRIATQRRSLCDGGNAILFTLRDIATSFDALVTLRRHYLQMWLPQSECCCCPSQPSMVNIGVYG
jgi:hypothetical protein